MKRSSLEIPSVQDIDKSPIRATKKAKFAIESSRGSNTLGSLEESQVISNSEITHSEAFLTSSESGKSNASAISVAIQ